MSIIHTDVLIIGAGMGGGCLARQLKLAMPDIKVTVIEKKKTFDYWIGESTVEAWVDYAYRLCGLGPYLHKHHMLKAGLRFFFDSEKKDLSLHEMSENGRAFYPGDILSHQLDRATFDRDLCELNREIGIEVLLGCRVLSDEGSKPLITIDSSGGHVVETSQGTIHCRWLVDAGGRTSPLSQKFNLVQKEQRHPVGSYWGRFEGTKNIDELGDESWQRRNNFNLRYLSTNHFMYHGYWIWLIPLSDKVVSIGVCFHQKMSPLKMKNSLDLLKFLRQHKAFQELLPESTKALDFMGFDDCSRHAKEYFSNDRWFLTGMAGFVIDALFSTTGITTSISNRLIGEMIKTDRSGNKALFEKQVRHFNIYMHSTYELILLMVSRYHEFGSYDAWLGFRPVTTANYYNTIIPTSTEDMKTFFDTVKSHADDCGCSKERTLEEQKRSLPFSILRINREMIDYLNRTKRFYNGNRGGYSEATPRASLLKKLFNKRNAQIEHLESLLSYETAFRHLLGKMAEYEGIKWSEAAFTDFFKCDWNSGQTLAMGLAALRESKTNEMVGANTKIRWTSYGPVDEYGECISPQKYFQGRADITKMKKVS